jgi:hypothetical protein
MVDRSANSVPVLFRTCRCHVLVVFSCLMTLLATVNSQLFTLFVPACLQPDSESPSRLPEDANDDVVLDPSAGTAHYRTSRKHLDVSSMRRHTQLVTGHSFLALRTHHLNLPVVAAREIDRRNGIGAPLLC